MRTLLLLVCTSVVASAQLFTLSKDQMLRFTAKNPYERFDDGRPKVPDAVLDKVKGLSAEEVWAVLPGRGFPNQYEGNWQILHPGKKLVGRVVTAQFMPMRPDVNEMITADGKAKGYYGGQNQWVIDQLQPGDVLVVDLFGKIEGGTFVGDNLFYYVMTKTKGGGLVVDGAIRDLEGIAPMDMAAYFRGVHPTPIQNVMLTGYNVPVRIGHTTVLPGDVAFGDREGLYFIPPHLVQEVVDRADVTHVHDDWTKQKFDTGKYKSGDIYGSPHDPALKKEYDDYLNKQLPNRKKAGAEH
jgi:4-hydroxy-4-methyl-2-oxoglutarate aldolase